MWRRAARLVEAAEAAGVALLTGHHRRHNPLMRQAKEAIDSGRLGQIVAVHGICWFYKPDDYFDAEWRRKKGAGPVFLNLIHDVDNLRYLCGDVVAVQAQETNALRGNEVEDAAVILLRFASGVLGTVNVSDEIVSPWSWELTSGENPAYTHTAESCYQIGGTRGSLTDPLPRPLAQSDQAQLVGADRAGAPAGRGRGSARSAGPAVLPGDPRAGAAPRLRPRGPRDAQGHRGGQGGRRDRPHRPSRLTVSGTAFDPADNRRPMEGWLCIRGLFGLSLEEMAKLREAELAKARGKS